MKPLATLPETTFALNLPPALVGGSGKHRIIVALAQNDDVLRRAPLAGVTITTTQSSRGRSARRAARAL